MKLLIVDDSQFIRDTLKIKIQDIDLQICEASNEKEAIEVYQKEKPDLVFMDVMMKKEDGGVYAVREILKINPKAKIVLITSLGGNDPYVKEAIDLGVIDVITKPFKKEELYRFLDTDSIMTSHFR